MRQEHFTHYINTILGWNTTDRNPYSVHDGKPVSVLFKGVRSSLPTTSLWIVIQEEENEEVTFIYCKKTGSLSDKKQRGEEEWGGETCRGGVGWREATNKEINIV